MITDFHDEETLKVWSGEFSRRLPNQIQDVARRKLRMLHNAQCTTDRGFAYPTEQSAGTIERQTRRAVEHPHQ